MKSVLRRRLMCAAMSVLFVLGGCSTPGNTPPTEPTGPAESSIEVSATPKARDCLRREFKDAGPWEQYLHEVVGNPPSQCGKPEWGNIIVTMERKSSLDDSGTPWLLRVWTNNQVDQPKRDVVVSNIEVMDKDQKIYPLVDVLTDGGKNTEAVFAPYLKKEKEHFDGSIEWREKYWTTTLGKALTFDDVYLSYSKLGETLQIGPSFKRSPEGVATHDWPREYYFEITLPSGDEFGGSFKFDVTVDGKKTTVVYQF